MTNRRELADRLEGGASGAFHPQMVADLREAARLLREPVAGEVEDYSSSKLADEMTFLVRRLRSKGDNAGADLLQTYQWRVREIDYRASQNPILRARLDDEGKGGEA